VAAVLIKPLRWGRSDVNSHSKQQVCPAISRRIFPEPGIHPEDFSARIGGSNLLAKDREFRAQESCCYLMQLI
jgi:hypothetical protein